MQAPPTGLAFVDDSFGATEEAAFVIFLSVSYWQEKED